ncbi:MAG: hypothetical protein ABIF40_01415 [archaeon]
MYLTLIQKRKNKKELFLIKFKHEKGPQNVQKLIKKIENIQSGKNLAAIITSNLSPSEFFAVGYGNDTAGVEEGRLLSRLQGILVSAEVKGEDYRSKRDSW